MCDCDKKCNNNCSEQPCGCLEKYSASCIVYDSEETLDCSGIPIGLTIEETIQNLDEYFCTFKTEIDNFITLVNLENGAKVYKGDNLLGQKQLRTLKSDNNSLSILENINDITFRLEPSSQTLAGIIEIATQAEVNAGLDTNKAVTPSTLLPSILSIISSPANLPDSSEVQKGIIEIATQAEVNAGTDNTRAVTPAKLGNYVTNEITNVVSNPANLPNASETERGIAEIATQAEVNAGTDNTRFVTPQKLNTFVSNEITDALGGIGTVPNATETERGIAEIATQAEVNAGTDNTRFVTPAKLGNYVTNEITNVVSNPANLPDSSEVQKGIIEIATQAEVNAGTDNTRAVTPAKLESRLNNITNIFTKYQEIVVNSWSIYVPQNLTHTLGEMPKVIQLSLRCGTSALGYTAGEEVMPEYHFHTRPDSPQAFGVSLVKSSTRVKFKVGHAFTIPENVLVNDGGADRADITGSSDTGNFRIVIRLFA